MAPDYQCRGGILLTELALTSIRLDGGTQPRVGPDLTVVAAYAQAMRLGAKFPAVTVFDDGDDLWLGGGFHRVQARMMAGFNTIDADLRDGTLRDAVLFSVGENAEHGQPRTNDDKRRAVVKLLTDVEWRRESDEWVAGHAKVGRLFVQQIRQEMYPAPPPSSILNTRSPVYRTAHRGGGTYQIDVSQIGKRDKERPLLPEEEELLSQFRGTESVYVLEKRERFKIGWSRYVNRRVGDLVREHETSTVIGVAAGSLQDERAIHAALSSGRDTGEWFVLSLDEVVGAFKQQGLDLKLRDGARQVAEPAIPRRSPAIATISGYREPDYRPRYLAVAEALNSIRLAHQNLPEPRTAAAEIGTFDIDLAAQIALWWTKFGAELRQRIGRTG